MPKGYPKNKHKDKYQKKGEKFLEDVGDRPKSTENDLSGRSAEAMSEEASLRVDAISEEILQLEDRLAHLRKSLRGFQAIIEAVEKLEMIDDPSDALDEDGEPEILPKKVGRPPKSENPPGSHSDFGTEEDADAGVDLNEDGTDLEDGPEA